MLHDLLRSPLKIFVFCVAFAFCSLLLNGGWMNLYGLHRDKAELQGQIKRLSADLKDLDQQIARSRDPAFVERQALDQLDMASEKDLVFVFSE